MTVAWARCWEAATTAPFSPWTQLLRQLNDETIPEAHRLNPGDAPDLARVLFFDDVVARVRRASTANPLLLVIDDLQWADVASVRLLAYLASSRRGMAVLALAAYRSGELSARTSVGEEVVALSRCGRHIPLGALGVGDVRDLVGSVTTRHDEVDPAILHHGGTSILEASVAILDRPVGDTHRAPNHVWRGDVGEVPHGSQGMVDGIALQLHRNAAMWAHCSQVIGCSGP